MKPLTPDWHPNSLIKRVKSIHQKTQKIWMLYDLMPSTNLTGGPWYTDNDFDHEFVLEICKIAESQARPSCPPVRRHHRGYSSLYGGESSFIRDTL